MTHCTCRGRVLEHWETCASCAVHCLSDTDEHWQLLPRLDAWLSGHDVPNRLFGSTINQDGDAI